MGGIITGQFSSWDFDGNPATTEDAGYNYCGGYLALDTYILSRAHPFGTDTKLNGLFGIVPTEFPLVFPENHMELPVINPQTTTALVGLGALASRDPKGEMKVWDEINLDKLSSQFPYVGLTLPLLFSKDLGQFLSGGIRPNRWRTTNEAGLGFLLDDNFFGMSGIVQVSAGFLDGGPVEDKHFPLPNGMGSIPVLSRLTKNGLGAGNLAFPSAYRRNANDQVPMYTWRNYNQVDRNKWTDKNKENTDIRELARSLGTLPLDFIEKYFPFRLVSENSMGLFGERSTGDLKHMIYEDGPAKRPTITFLAEDGPAIIADTAIDFYGEKVILPGYQHLDPLTAAPVQHDGSEEQTMARTVSYLKRNFSVK